MANPLVEPALHETGTPLGEIPLDEINTPLIQSALDQMGNVSSELEIPDSDALVRLKTLQASSISSDQTELSFST